MLQKLKVQSLWLAGIILPPKTKAPGWPLAFPSLACRGSGGSALSLGSGCEHVVKELCCTLSPRKQATRERYTRQSNVPHRHKGAEKQVVDLQSALTLYRKTEQN